MSELRELLAKATAPGGWFRDGEYIRGGHFGVPQTIADCRYKNGVANADLIVHLANNAEAIAELIEALDDIANSRPSSAYWTDEAEVYALREKAREALAKLEPQR